MRHSGHWEDSEAHSTERRELRCGCGLRDDIVSCHPREELGHSLGRVVAVGVGGGGSSRTRARPFCVGGILVCLFLDMDIPSCEESDNRILLEIVSPVIPGIKFPHVH